MLDLSPPARAIAAFGLVNAPTAHAPTAHAAPAHAPTDDEGWRAFLDELRRHRLRGPAAVAHRHGALTVADERLDEFAESVASMAAVILEIDTLMLRLVSATELDLVVLKGCAHAQLDYPDPSWRDYSDLDLLVPADQAPHLVREMERRGFERSFAEVAPEWAEQFGKSVTMADSHLEVDIHRHLSQGLGLGIPPDELRARVTTFQWGGVEVRALDAPTRLVHAAVHLLGGSEVPPVSSVRDIAHMAQDPNRVAAALNLAGRWDLRGTLAVAVRIAAGELGGLPSKSLEVVRDVRPSTNERARLAILRRSPGFRANVAAGLLSARTMGDRRRYIAALAKSRRSDA